MPELPVPQYRMGLAALLVEHFCNRHSPCKMVMRDSSADNLSVFELSVTNDRQITLVVHAPFAKESVVVHRDYDYEPYNWFVQFLADVQMYTHPHMWVMLQYNGAYSRNTFEQITFVLASIMEENWSPSIDEVILLFPREIGSGHDRFPLPYNRPQPPTTGVPDLLQSPEVR